MSQRLNWRNAFLSSKPKLSTLDEKEYRERDAAARWLARHDKPKAKKPAPSKERATA